MSLDIEALYAQEHDRLCGYIRKRLDGHDPIVAEDIAGAAFLRAWEKRRQYRPMPGIRPKSWLYRIAANLLIDHHRERSCGKVAVVRLSDLKPYIEHVGTSDHVERIDARQAVSAALGTLTSQQRAVIVGRFWEGREHKQMGHVVTLNGSKKLQIRAIANLRRALEVA